MCCALVRTQPRLSIRHLMAALLQVMPWPVFGKKTDRDLKAVYEYLRAIPQDRAVHRRLKSVRSTR